MTSPAWLVTPLTGALDLKTQGCTHKYFSLLRGRFLLLSPFRALQGFLHLIIARKMYPTETVLRLEAGKKSLNGGLPSEGSSFEFKAVRWDGERILSGRHDVCWR